jgi:hypothetical protein
LKIAAGVNTYANPDGLEICLESLSGVDKRLVIHGRYPHFQDVDPYSESKTKAVCTKYPDTQLIQLDAPELEKRQKYLELSEGFDFLLVIDDDEYITQGADWQLFKKTCQNMIEHPSQYYIYDIMFDGPIAESGPRPRLFYQPSKIKYERKHYWWRLPNGRLADGMSDSCKVVDGIRITHDKTPRMNGKYNLASLEYQHYLLEYESQYVRTAADL